MSLYFHVLFAYYNIAKYENNFTNNQKNPPTKQKQNKTKQKQGKIKLNNTLYIQYIVSIERINRLWVTCLPTRAEKEL